MLLASIPRQLHDSEKPWQADSQAQTGWWCQTDATILGRGLYIRSCGCGWGRGLIPFAAHVALLSHCNICGLNLCHSNAGLVVFAFYIACHLVCTKSGPPWLYHGTAQGLQVKLPWLCRHKIINTRVVILNPTSKYGPVNACSCV